MTNPLEPKKFIPFKHGKNVIRKVRTPEGAKKYGQPIGTIITPDMEEFAKKHLPKLDPAKYPVGTDDSKIAQLIANKHGAEHVDKLFPDAQKAWQGGQSVIAAINHAEANHKKKQVPAYIKGKPVGWLPPGTDIYVGKSFANNPKDAGNAYARNGDQYFNITASGITPVSSNVSFSLKKAFDSGVFAKIPYGYGDVLPESDKPNAPDVSTSPVIETAKKAVAALKEKISTKKKGGKKFEVLDDPGQSGDGYFDDPGGAKLWGKHGSAGVLLRYVDPESKEERFLLVQRGPIVSTNKGKWQLPGGALNSNEDDYQGTARELTEELSPPEGYIDKIKPKGEVLFNHESGWHYNNIAADVDAPFAPQVDGNETGDAKWFTREQIKQLDVHPALKDNLDKIFSEFDKPGEVNTVDEDTESEKFADVSVNVPNPDVVDSASTPGSATKPLFINGKQITEIPADSKIYVGSHNSDYPDNATTAYIVHSDGTGETFSSFNHLGSKISQSAVGVLKGYVNSGVYIDADEAKKKNEAAAIPEAPNVPKTESVIPDWEKDLMDAAEKDQAAKGSPSLEESIAKDTAEVPTKAVYLQGKKVGDVPEDSEMYILSSWVNDSNPKNAPFAYVKNSDGTFSLYNNDKQGEKATPITAKYIQEDIDSAFISKIDNFDQVGDGTPSDVNPSDFSLKAPAEALVNVGGVDVTSSDITSAITQLKNGASWQVKVHLKGHPLHDMDYVNLAKDYNKKHGKTLPTKEAVIRALEEKGKNLPHTDAEEAVIEDVGKDPNIAPEDKPNPHQTVVGGIAVNKGQLEGAIALVENGPSAYPKVNLKGHVLHGLDMAQIMKDENKKVDQPTKDVLLKHLKKKLSEFHEDEITGESLAPDPNKPLVAEDPVKVVEKAVEESHTNKPMDAPQSNLVDANGLQVQPGIYKKPGGYFAHVEVTPDGKFFYQGSKKTGKLPITKKKFKSLHESGFSHYTGGSEAPTSPEVEIKEEAPHAPGLAPGKYHAYMGGTYEIFSDGSALFTSNYGGSTVSVTPKDMLGYVHQGSVYDKYGTTQVYPGMPILDSAEFRVLGSSPLTLQQFKDLRTKVADSPFPLSMLEAQYGVKHSNVLDFGANHDFPPKNSLLSTMDGLISSLEMKKNDTPDIVPDQTPGQQTYNNIFPMQSDTGFAIPYDNQPVSISGMTNPGKTAKIKAISNHFTDPYLNTIVGNNVIDFTPSITNQWLDAWYTGDMKKVYQLDKLHADSNEDLSYHPGAPGNEGTHKIVWAPAVEGEVPAGQPVHVLGGHLDPLAKWPKDHVDNYLTAANAQNTEFMDSQIKGQWAKAHYFNDKLTVDALSLAAKKAKDEGHNPQGIPAVANPDAEKPKTSYQEYIDSNTGVYGWPHQAIDDFLNDKGLYKTTNALDNADVVQDFLEGKKSLEVNGTLLWQVPVDSKIYTFGDGTSKVYVKHADGTFHKYGTVTSKFKYGTHVTNETSISIWNAEIDSGGLTPFEDKTEKEAPTVATFSGPLPISVKNGKILSVLPGDEIHVYTNGQGVITGAFVKNKDGDIKYHGSTNDWKGVPASQGKLQSNIDSGLVKPYTNPHNEPEVVAKAVADAAPAAPVNKVYTILGSEGLALGNNQETTKVADQFGNKYVFKPYSGSELFRAHVEHGANLIARKFGFATAESEIVEINGKKGQLQAAHPTQKDFVGMGASDISKLSQDQLNSLAKEHLLDWALENPDSRALNMHVLNDGSIVGIDKGMFGKYWGTWDGLQPNSQMVVHDPLVYQDLYSGIASGLYSQSQVDSMYKSVMQKARAMEKVSDADLKPFILEAMETNPNQNAEEFANNFLARKNQLTTDMDILWDRVYATTLFTKPEIKNDITNVQGHVVHAGFTPDHLEAVSQTKSYGTAAMFGGTDIEDMHVLMWREKIGPDQFNTRGELKIRDTALYDVESWLSSRATDTTGFGTPPAPVAHPKDPTWHDSILKAAGNVAYHSEDGKYNPVTLDKMTTSKIELQLLLKDNEQKLAAASLPADLGGGPLSADDLHQINAQNDMAKLYLGYIKDVEIHKDQGTKASKDAVKKYAYTPPYKTTPLEAVEAPKVKVEKIQATRAKNISPGNSNQVIKLDSDGEMLVSTNEVLDDSSGNSGYMYLVTLPTGEQIEVRGNTTGTYKVSQGLTRYTIPAGSDTEVSLSRIQNQLKEMGLDLKPAEEDDYELFYWRHLANIMRDRKDSQPHHMGYEKFWAKFDKDKENKGGPEETEMWRNAFSTITSAEQVKEWVEGGHHLPQFQHMDIRNPTQATSKPYWLRFDVKESDWDKHDFLIMQSSSDEYAASVVETGGSLSTEGRLRAFGSWLSGSITLSSSTDQERGSASYIFTRQSMTDSLGSVKVILSKRASAKTSNYSFTDDNCGDISKKKTQSPFNFADAMNRNPNGYDSGNETMIKDGASLLDDIEMVFVSSQQQLDESLALLRSHGITSIRGVPIELRIINGGSYGGSDLKKQALKALKEYYAKHKK